MALRQSINFEGNSVVETIVGNIQDGVKRVSVSFYIKVVSVKGDKSTMLADVNFKNETQSFGKRYEIPVSVELNAKNFIAQAYAHLKTLPEFANAVDC